jgi:hypothetical protein
VRELRRREVHVRGTLEAAERGMIDGVRVQGRAVSLRAADRLQTVAEGTGKVLDRGGDALRRAEALVQDTKEQVSDALRRGQDAIRPTPSAREA